MHSPLSALFLSVLTVVAVALPAASGQPTVSIVTVAPTLPVLPGQSVTMTVSTSDSLAMYQWQRNRTDIPGATGASYRIMAAGAADRGSYAAVVTGAGGTVTADMGTLAVMKSDARLVNLSARGMVGTGNDVMIAGFVTQGDGSSTNKSILMRSMGPSLSGMMGGMNSGVLVRPTLTIFDDQSRMMGGNTGWTNAPTPATGGGTSTVQATMQSASMSMMSALGAFVPTTGSVDSALMMTAPSGAYTAIMSGFNHGTGVGLVECYDADSISDHPTNTARLVNMSARANAGAGNSSLIAGFVVAPGPLNYPATLLLRVMGPSLTRLGVTNVLSMPSLTLFDSASKPIASNTGWGNAPTMAAGPGGSSVRAGVDAASAGMMAVVGAYPAAAGSSDSALVATLPPGAYSMVISGPPDGPGQPSSGIVLIEIYEMR
jgi:hypothetical protein